VKGLAPSVRMQGSSTREDDDDGWRRRHSEGWVGSWAVDRC